MGISVCVRMEMGHPQKAGIRATGKPDRPDFSSPVSPCSSKEDVVTLKAESEEEAAG